jgi:hypothetical protein
MLISKLEIVVDSFIDRFWLRDRGAKRRIPARPIAANPLIRGFGVLIFITNFPLFVTLSTFPSFGHF